MKAKLPWYFWIGILGLLVSQVALFAKLNPVSIYFCVFIWWFYIITIDGLVLRIKGSSLFTRLRAKIFLLILFSFCFWMFFEILDLRMANWHYTGFSFFSNHFWLIIFGIFAFGAVLPAILETYEVLEGIGLGRNLKFPRWKWWGRPRYLWMAAGVAMLAISLIWPQYFVWMTWILVVFILDPDVEANSGKSLFFELRQGKAQTFCLLLLTGLICGFLWEFWNYWAEIKWVYTVSLFGRFGEWKIFEMPVLGYLGFPVLALEGYVFYQWLGCQRARLVKLLGFQSSE